MTEEIHDSLENNLFERIFKLMHGTEWAQRMQELMVEFYMPAARRRNMSADEYLVNAGIERIVILSRLVFDELMTRQYGRHGDINVVSDFIAKIQGVHSNYELSKQLEICEGVRATRISLYEVVDITRGERTVLRDMIYGGDDIAIEHTALLSEMTELWQCMAGRVIQLDDVPFLVPTYLQYDQQIAGDFLEKLEGIVSKKQKLRSGKKKSDSQKNDFLRKRILSELPMAQLLADSWNTAIDQRGEMRFGLPPLKLGTVEGDTFQICEVVFRVRKDCDSVRRKLDNVPRLSRMPDEDQKWNWLAPGHQLKEYLQAIPNDGPQIEQAKDEDEYLEFIGTVELRSSSVKLFATSKERAEAGRRLLEFHLGDLISNPMTSHVNSLEEIKKIMKSFKPGSSKLSNPEILTGMHSSFRDIYFATCLDAPIQDYDYKTPREMANSPKDRRKALEWLKMRESTDILVSREENREPYDFAWLWLALGFDRSKASPRSR